MKIAKLRVVAEPVPGGKCAVTFDEVIEALRTLDNVACELERVANIIGTSDGGETVRAMGLIPPTAVVNRRPSLN